MNEMKTDDVGKLRAAGVIDLPTLQRSIFQSRYEPEARCRGELLPAGLTGLKLGV
jgi:hypothetical protein